MALADRIKHPSMDPAVVPIAVHQFTAAFSLWVQGHITPSDVQTYFNLDTQEQSQVQTIKAAYDGLSTDAEKSQWLHRLENAGILYEMGAIDATAYRNIVGL